VYYELNAPLKSHDFRHKCHYDWLLTFPHTLTHPHLHTHVHTFTPTCTPSLPRAHPHTHMHTCSQELLSLCPDNPWDDQLISLTVETNPEGWITLNGFLAFWT